MRLVASTLVLGLASAQDVGIPPNIADWFASQASLALVVVALVALVRKHVWKTLDGPAVVGASLILGIGLAYIGHRLGYLGADWLVFGLGAGVLASGGVDAVRAVLRKGQDGQGGSSSTVTDAERARLR